MKKELPSRNGTSAFCSSGVEVQHFVQKGKGYIKGHCDILSTECSAYSSGTFSIAGCADCSQLGQKVGLWAVWAGNL